MTMIRTNIIMDCWEQLKTKGNKTQTQLIWPVKGWKVFFTGIRPFTPHLRPW